MPHAWGLWSKFRDDGSRSRRGHRSSDDENSEYTRRDRSTRSVHTSTTTRTTLYRYTALSVPVKIVGGVICFSFVVYLRAGRPGCGVWVEITENHYLELLSGDRSVRRLYRLMTRVSVCILHHVIIPSPDDADISHHQVTGRPREAHHHHGIRDRTSENRRCQMINPRISDG